MTLSKENILQTKGYAFAVKIVKLTLKLQKEEK